MLIQLFDFLIHLNQEQKFDLLKVLLDKLLLAAIVGVAGLISTILIERWKSGVKKQEEYAKVALPAIISLNEDSKKLFNKGMRVINDLNYHMKDFKDWAETIVKSEYRLKNRDCLLEGREDYDFSQVILINSENSEATYYEFLLMTCPNLITRERSIKSGVFGKKNFSKKGYFYTLLTQLGSADRRLNDASHFVIAHVIQQDVFIDAVREPRNDFSSAIDDFLHAVIIKLPLTSRKHNKMADNISAIVRNIGESIQNYPRGYMFRLPSSVETPSIESLMINAHSAIVSQVRKISHKL